MKIALFTKEDKYLTKEEVEQWSEIAIKHNIEFYINCDIAHKFGTDRDNLEIKCYQNSSDLPDDISFAVSYGGDGTFLHSIEIFRGTNIPILGVNSGRLGFLASIRRDEIEEAISALKNGEYTIEERPLIEVSSMDVNGHAFNEFAIQRKTIGMIDVTLTIDGEYVANYMADGLIISTPSGSTAYSMSVGGPIMSPSCNCYIINPISPHNLNMRPLVISDNSVIEISGESRNREMYATIDNRSIEVQNNQKIVIKKSRHNARLVKLSNISFFNTIREKLMWGIDSRQINISK